MNYYVIIPFFALLYNVAITAYSWSQRRTPVNRAYVLLSLTTMGWILFDVIHWSPIPASWVIPALKLQSIFYLSIGFVFTNFSYRFLNKEKDAVYFVFLTAILIAVPISLASNWFIRDYTPLYWGPAIVGGPLYVPLIFSLIIPQYTYSLILLYGRMRVTRDSAEKQQIILFLSGNILAALESLVSVVIFPEFLGMNPLPLHDIGIMIHLGFISWAIVKYRFLALNVDDIATDLFSNVKEGVVLLDIHSKVLQANNAALTIFNVSTPNQLDSRIPNLLDTIRQKSIEGEFEYKPEETGYKTVRVSMSPVLQSGRVIGSIIFMQDITQQKQTEGEIQKVNRDLARARDEALSASRAKSDFLANMSHELRTPLNAIIGYSELLLEEAEDEQKADISNDLLRIKRSGEHLLSLINDVLDLSKIEAGKMELRCESFAPIDLIEEVMTTIEPLARKRDNRLEVSMGSELGEIYADRVKLRQVLINLLSNACKFTEHGTIQLAVTRVHDSDGDYMNIAIQDTGIGISKDAQSALFEQFKQIDSSRSRKYEGSGLGLALSRQFCHMMGGEILLKSEVGKGSIFTVVLPATVDRVLT
ncbi:MAG: ATP-binding protein [Acidiferrobacterales bacterium]|nr:ATP-binding protein [Acidiferrobacterales bacterium]